MAKKLIITEKQLQVIARQINEDETALTELLTEGVIEEGFKEIALSLLMLAGVTLTGQNKAIAQNSLTNQEIIQKVNNVLSDTTQLNKLIDRIDNKMPNAGELIQQNAEKIKSTIAYLDAKNKKKDKVSYTTDTQKTTSPSVLRTRLSQGYAISDVIITRDTILPKGSSVIVQDTIDFKWSSDNFFNTGTFDLSVSTMDSISIVVNDIKLAGGKIVGVFIESSTDTEPIKMGNEQLSLLRAQSVENFMMTLDLTDAKFTTTTKPNNGPNLFEPGMTKGDRVEARIKTAPYRYVTIRLVVVFEEEVKGGETAPQVIERHQYELVKITTSTNKTVRMHYTSGAKTKCKKLKIKKDDGSTTPMDCVFDQ